MTTLRALRNERGQIDTPLAVVVTKADAFGLEAQIGAARATPLPGPVSEDSSEESQHVRHWLKEHGERNLVQCIEHDFRTVRFFYCSALGRLPDGTASPFVPRGVLRPFGWALGRQGLTLHD